MYYFHEGSLEDIKTQGEVLAQAGLEIDTTDVYPSTQTESEYIKGLKIIYNQRIGGWQVYRSEGGLSWN